MTQTKVSGGARLRLYYENVAEAGSACLITMVQGNVLALSIGHWLIASQTGLIAGAIAATIFVTSGMKKRWAISLMLGLITGLVDFYVHPGTLSAMAIGEAAVTGTGAALISFLVGRLVIACRVRREQRYS